MSSPTTRVLLNVTQGNIDAANRYRRLRGVISERCPIALAAGDAGLRNPEVRSNTHGYTVHYDVNGGRWRSPLSRAARRFIERYDGGQHVEPTRFRVEVES